MDTPVMPDPRADVVDENGLTHAQTDRLAAELTRFGYQLAGKLPKLNLIRLGCELDNMTDEMNLGGASYLQNTLRICLEEGIEQRLTEKYGAETAAKIWCR